MTGQEPRRPGVQVAEMSETVEEPVSALIVALRSGTVRVVPSDGSATTIDAEIECDADDPLPTISWTVQGGRLEIDVQTPETTGRGTVQLTVATPRDAAVSIAAQFARIDVAHRDAVLDLTTVAGSIRVQETTGELTLRSKAAAITVTDVRAESMLLETQAGSIVASGVDAQFARFASQLGRVTVSFDNRPRVVEASTTVGKLHVAVPAGTYSANLSGRVRIGDGIVIAAGSDHQLDVSVGLGAARITTSDS